MISDILTQLRARGLRGAELYAAMRRRAKVLSACDPRDAAELLTRAGKRPARKAAKRGKRSRREALDPVRAAWAEYDRRHGL